MVEIEHKLKHINYCFCDNIDCKNEVHFFVQKECYGNKYTIK